MARCEGWLRYTSLVQGAPPPEEWQHHRGIRLRHCCECRDGTHCQRLSLCTWRLSVSSCLLCFAWCLEVSLTSLQEIHSVVMIRFLDTDKCSQGVWGQKFPSLRTPALSHCHQSWSLSSLERTQFRVTVHMALGSRWVKVVQKCLSSLCWAICCANRFLLWFCFLGREAGFAHSRKPGYKTILFGESFCIWGSVKEIVGEGTADKPYRSGSWSKAIWHNPDLQCQAEWP